MLNRIIGEDIAIHTELEPDPWTVRADAGNIEQVIMNLAVNARDAMPTGGQLTIKTENVTLDQEYCKVMPGTRPGRFMCLTIEDSGVGMDKETIKHIFEPFFTTKGVGIGTGLGLSVVHGIVKQHQGWINVYSEPGQGSTFKVYLPAISAKPEEITKEAISLQEFRGNGERILVVEDEKVVRDFCVTALSDSGYLVFEAATAQEALDTFERQNGNFNLVFADIVLPDKTGLDLVDHLISIKPELRVLLCSGFADKKSRWEDIRERGHRFLHKPYELVQLLRTVKEVLTQ